ncbi:MAG: ABC transporter ATP-binding protein [Desulfobacteraceae bacterium]|nr:ABC transporter ATP-binding protein [Desulfobacteraceae bacterium]
MTLLEIKDLSTIFKTRRGDVNALDGVSLSVDHGCNFGLVGESGCGKSTLLKSIVGVLPPNAAVTGGQVLFDGRDLTKMDEDALRKIRWKEISMITQSALNALDPVYTVGDQIAETIRIHEKADKSTVRKRISQMFGLVGIDAKRFNEYPHQFSGGMRQRAIIAMSLILEPKLVIADEPTTSLDVIVQDQIFTNIRRLQRSLGFSMFLVTHDIAVVIENCDRIGIMYGGKIMEIGPVAEVVSRSFHPYTMGLKNSFPNIVDRRCELISIPGVPPTLMGTLHGCRFAERCPFAADICRSHSPVLTRIGADHHAACHFTDRVESMREKAARAGTWGDSHSSR